jgi:hypothetical protein
MENVDIPKFEELDFSNTVALFGIYEPIDLLQYEISLGLGFHSSVPVKSPHAVHEELYYRGLIETLTQSRTCEEFVNNIPFDFFDMDTPLEHADFFYRMFFNFKLNSSKENLDLIENIKHPTAYWVSLKTVLYSKDTSKLERIEEDLFRYFTENTQEYSVPAKFIKRINSIRQKLSKD